MKIKKLHIKNFKSIADLEIIEPSPFTVFVGPNGAGKSNIFEAIQYRILLLNTEESSLVKDLFPNVFNFNAIPNHLYSLPTIEISFLTFKLSKIRGLFRYGVPYIDEHGTEHEFFPFKEQPQYKQFIENYSLIFIKNKDREKIPAKSDIRLSSSCDNLEKVLKRILQDENKREEMVEWLSLFIPGFENLEILSSELSGTDTLLMYEKGSNKPFTKDLLSDGTFNILALLAAVYQSDEPQFLCIEEPENGLTPSVIKEMVTLFRNACEEKGHYIWLNTHSQSLVSQLTADELITVNKVNGETQIKQFRGKDFHGLSMDEAWLTNSLGGGLPW